VVVGLVLLRCRAEDGLLPADGDDRKEPVDNFKYLFEDRKWPQEHNLHGDELHVGQDNLAQALEAATTGHPSGEMPDLDTPAHTPEQAKLMNEIVTSVSEDPERLTKNGYMSDSMGRMASEYLADINRSTTDVDYDPSKPLDQQSDAWKEVARLFPNAGAQADFSHTDVSRFLISVGQNPEGYAAVEVGEKKYMGYLMDYHLNPDLPEDARYHQDVENTIKEISRRTGEVSGSLAIGRQEAVLGPAKEKDDAYNHAVAQWKNIASGTIGTVTGVGTSLIASPVAGAAVGGAAGTVSSVVLEELFNGVEGEHLKDSGHTVGELWEDSRKNNTAMVQAAVAKAVQEHHLPEASSAGEWARSGLADGYLDASANGRHMADDLTTEIPS
jgi:hypothetical protein